MAEKWNTVNGGETYKVSRTGKVCVLRGGSWEEVPHKVFGEDGSRPLSVKVHVKGVDGSGRYVSVARLVLGAFRGERPELYPVFRDGNPLNVHLSNLEWGTRGDVERSKRARGTAYAGKRHHNASITPAQAKRIKALILEGRLSNRAIGEKYGLHESSVRNIRNGKTWAHVEV